MSDTPGESGDSTVANAPPRHFIPTEDHIAARGAEFSERKNVFHSGYRHVNGYCYRDNGKEGKEERRVNPNWISEFRNYNQR